MFDDGLKPSVLLYPIFMPMVPRHCEWGSEHTPRPAGAANVSGLPRALRVATVSAGAFSPNIPSFPRRFVLRNVNRFAVCEEL